MLVKAARTLVNYFLAESTEEIRYLVIEWMEFSAPVVLTVLHRRARQPKRLQCDKVWVPVLAYSVLGLVAKRKQPSTESSAKDCFGSSDQSISRVLYGVSTVTVISLGARSLVLSSSLPAVS